MVLEHSVFKGIFWNIGQSRYQVGLNGLAIFRYISDALAFQNFGG